jgi:hypothetical protein
MQKAANVLHPHCSSIAICTVVSNLIPLGEFSKIDPPNIMINPKIYLSVCLVIAATKGAAPAGFPAI